MGYNLKIGVLLLFIVSVTAQAVEEIPAGASPDTLHQFMEARLTELNVYPQPLPLTCNPNPDPARLAMDITQEQFEINLGAIHSIGDNEDPRYLGQQYVQLKTKDLEAIKQRETYRDCGLTDMEAIAIMTYTEAEYKHINESLRSADPQERERYRVLVRLIISGLEKLANYDGWVLRTSGPKESPSADSIRYLNFVSTTRFRGVANALAGGILSVLRVRDCKYIAPISTFDDEEEVLCPPDTNFTIVHSELSGFGLRRILIQTP